MEPELIVAVGILIVFMLGAGKFVCESHELDLIKTEFSGQGLKKVECGNKKPEQQYDNYKVFTK